MARINKNLSIENARMIFLNFEGREEKYNRRGDRNFAVALEAPLAEQLAIDGWNIKCIQPHDEYEEPLYYLPVAVSYSNIPPKVYLVTSRNKVLLDEDTVAQVDTLDIATTDLIITPYNWEVNGKSGVKAYLKTAYITIEEDEFAYKYDRSDI